MAHHYRSLVAPEGLPDTFFTVEHITADGGILWEDGDDRIASYARQLKQALETYRACWLVYEPIDHDFFRGQVIAVTEDDFYHGCISFSTDIQERVALPIYFTAQQLTQVLVTEPGPVDPQPKGSHRTPTSGEPVYQEQPLQDRPLTRLDVHPFVQASEVFSPIAISRDVLTQAQKKMVHRPGHRSRSSLFFRLALNSLVEQRRYSENVLEKRDLKKTERKLRTVLKKKGIFYTIVTENHQPDIPYTVEISTYTALAA